MPAAISPFWPDFWAAFTLGLSLILAIGPQNAFVIRQGLKREHVLLAALACAGADTLTMSLGVLGVGRLLAQNPLLTTLGTLTGAAFLVWYGWQALQSARHSQRPELQSGAATTSVRAVLLAALGFSLLNPHALLDTLVLIGGASASANAPMAFLGGVVAASWTWFALLAIASTLLAPLMRSARMWQAIDALVALMMWGIALKLLLGIGDL